MRIRGGPCAIQDIKASCPLFLRHAASAGGFAESTWNSLLYHGLEPCGPGSVAAAPGADDGPTSQLCLFFRSSNRENVALFSDGDAGIPALWTSRKQALLVVWFPVRGLRSSS